MKKFNQEQLEEMLSKCSRCKQRMFKCRCNRSHPTNIISDMYRIKPIGNPDTILDRGNKNYLKINKEILEGILG